MSYPAPIWLNTINLTVEILIEYGWFDTCPSQCFISDFYTRSHLKWSVTHWLTVKHKTKGFISSTLHINSGLSSLVCFLCPIYWIVFTIHILFLYLPWRTWLNIRNCFQGVVKKHGCQIWFKWLFHASKFSPLAWLLNETNSGLSR